MWAQLTLYRYNTGTNSHSKNAIAQNPYIYTHHMTLQYDEFGMGGMCNQFCTFDWFFTF